MRHRRALCYVRPAPSELHLTVSVPTKLTLYVATRLGEHWGSILGGGRFRYCVYVDCETY
jgi:hypothetical protein